MMKLKVVCFVYEGSEASKADEAKTEIKKDETRTSEEPKKEEIKKEAKQIEDTTAQKTDLKEVKNGKH